MQFERINRGKNPVSRRIHVPGNIREWATIQTLRDSRKRGKKATLLDVYLNLVNFALPEKKRLVYSRKFTDGEPGNVMQFPETTYKALEQIRDKIKSGQYKKEGTHNIDVLDVFLNLLEHGFQKMTETHS